MRIKFTKADAVITIISWIIMLTGHIVVGFVFLSVGIILAGFLHKEV
jgi:hypothetical protein